MADQDMTQRLERLFSPAVTFCYRGRFRTLLPFYYPDKLQDRTILRQLMEEAGVDRSNGVRVREEDLDKIMEVAGQYGYSVTTIKADEEDKD